MSDKQSRRKGKVRFNSKDNQRVVLSNDSEKVAYRKSVRKTAYEYPKCDGRTYPCYMDSRLIENKQDLANQMKLLHRNRGSYTRREISEQLERAGKYKRYIPMENRLYNLDTGEIYDIASYRLPATRKSKPKTKKFFGFTFTRRK